MELSSAKMRSGKSGELAGSGLDKLELRCMPDVQVEASEPGAGRAVWAAAGPPHPKGVLTRRGDVDTQRGTKLARAQTDGHVPIRGEGGCRLQDKGRGCRKSSPADTLTSDSQPPEL